MKFLLALSIIAAFAAAQDLSGEPACASSCLSSAISAAGCAQNDQACQCGTGHALVGSYAAPCLLAACTNAADLGAAASVGAALCSIYSASITSASAMSLSSSAVTSPSLSTGAPSTTTTPHRSTGSSDSAMSTSSIATTNQRSTGSSEAASTTSSIATTNQRSTGSSSAAAATTTSASLGNTNKPVEFETKFALAMGSVVAGFMMFGAVLLG